MINLLLMEFLEQLAEKYPPVPENPEYLEFLRNEGVKEVDFYELETGKRN